MRDAGGKRSRLKAALDFLKRLLGKKPAQPEDPYAYRMAPLRRSPRQGGAAAVVELDVEEVNEN